MNKFCSKCGEPIESTDAFCGSCGKPLGQHPNDASKEKAAAPDPEKREDEEKIKELPIGSPIDYLRMSLKKYANASGRSRRAEYWYFNLMVCVGLILIGLIVGLVAGIFSIDTSGITDGITTVYYLAILLPSLGVTVRRLHDTGRSGWWLLLSFAPFGVFILLMFLISNGDKETNKYGDNPKLIA